MSTFLVQHITGGDAFFTGIVLLVVAVVLANRTKWQRTRGGSLSLIVAVLLIAASATPLPWWLYGLLAAAVIAWYGLLAARRAEQGNNTAEGVTNAQVSSPNEPTGHRRLLLTAVLLLLIVAAAGWELRWRFTPRVPLDDGGRLIILADSVTAGIGESEAVRWPELLADKNPSIEIDDRSKMGATVGSVLELVEERPLDEGVVLIEIGGNDLLGSTSIADFERDLDRLLALATADGRKVVMFELPLPPGSNSWGLVQRRLANQHGVSLIPKRRFASILLSGELTLDSIHLSQAGHERMARLMEEVLGLETNE